MKIKPYQVNTTNRMNIIGIQKKRINEELVELKYLIINIFDLQ